MRHEDYHTRGQKQRDTSAAGASICALHMGCCAHNMHAILGQALEPEAERQARKQRVADALAQYKRQAGLQVEPRAEAAAKLVYARGEELMRRVRRRRCACACSA